MQMIHFAINFEKISNKTKKGKLDKKFKNLPKRMEFKAFLQQFLLVR